MVEYRAHLPLYFFDDSGFDKKSPEELVMKQSGEEEASADASGLDGPPENPDAVPVWVSGPLK